MTVLPDLGPEVGTSGDGPRSVGERVVRTSRTMRTNAKHEPRSMVRPAGSAANQKERAV